MLLVSYRICACRWNTAAYTVHLLELIKQFSFSLYFNFKIDVSVTSHTNTLAFVHFNAILSHLLPRHDFFLLDMFFLLRLTPIVRHEFCQGHEQADRREHYSACLHYTAKVQERERRQQSVHGECVTHDLSSHYSALLCCPDLQPILSSYNNIDPL